MIEGKTLVTKGSVDDQWEELGDQREDLGNQRQREDLNNSQMAMPQIEKQTGWTKRNQLPAGTRE